MNFRKYNPKLDRIGFLVADIWHRERQLPKWFRDASDVWHPTFELFEEFCENCDEIWYCEEANLVVYLEALSKTAINIHVSVLRQVDQEKLIEAMAWLRERKAADGVTTMIGWLYERNRGLRRIAKAVGFSETGLKMDFGQARGEVLRWVQVRNL